MSEHNSEKEIAENGQEMTKNNESFEASWPERLNNISMQGRLFSLSRHLIVPMMAIFVSLLVTGQSHIIMNYLILPLFQFTWRTLATTLGVGLGLGISTHVYDLLEEWRSKNDNDDSNTIGTTIPPPLPRRERMTSATSSSGIIQQASSKSLGVLVLGKSTHNFGDDVNSYASLMSSAGYNVCNEGGGSLLRGQLVNNNNNNNNKPSYYTYTHDTNNTTWLAVKFMQQQCPHLPDCITLSLGKFMEHVIRDYVASWYSMIDGACPYVNEKEYQQKMKYGEPTKEPDDHDDNNNNNIHHRTMILSLHQHRPIPLLQSMYSSLSIVFGELSSRVEHVNIFELLLLKWTRVLSMTLRTYRQLRQLAVTKQLMHANNQNERATSISSDNMSSPPSSKSKRRLVVLQQKPVSEMIMTKEFLLAGKLHKALTFGMDVPSLLFADPSGKECGLSCSEEEILEQRLFPIIGECELDYNRVLSHRMCRALLPRSEFSSPIIRTIMTELLAGCILTPIMGCFSPDYLNYWITCYSKEEEENGNTGVVAENKQEQEQEDQRAVVDDKSSGVDEVKGGDDDSIEATAKASEQEAADEEAEEGVELTMSQVHFSDDEDDALSNDGDEENGDGGEEDSSGDLILPLLTMAVIELQRFMDFEECREARRRQEQLEINWNEAGCKEAVTSLVLVIEAALLHGRRKKRLLRKKKSIEVEEGDDLAEVEMALEEEAMSPLRASSLSQLLMEITSDLDAFETLVAQEEAKMESADPIDYDEDEEDSEQTSFKPSASELSTLRTLISAWLHTGQAYRTISVLIRARQSILRPFFRERAFLCSEENASGFVRQLRALEDVEVMVDTSSVLASATLDVSGKTNVSDQMYQQPRSHDVEASGSTEPPGGSPRLGPRQNGANMSRRLSRFIPLAVSEASIDANSSIRRSTASPGKVTGASSTPRYLDFHRNENFAASLRTERERRQLSWQTSTSSADEKGLRIVSRVKGCSEEDVAQFRELHHVARILYSGTNLLGLRDGARRKEASETGDMSTSQATNSSEITENEMTRLSLLTVEMASPRRRLEIPDDDSSFLLRAQPRPLNAIGVHRDQMNHDSSYKCFAATYEEPALRPDSTKYTGGRYIRRCQLRYYPSDRTANIVLSNDPRTLDQRKGYTIPPETITVGGTTRASQPLSGDFLRKRHLCQKWNPRGATQRSGSILASSVMEPTDFNAVPRPGKAVDFLYRMSLFERPMVELSTKVFTVHDSGASGTHRADASSLELSDASLSVALLLAGRDWEDHSSAAGNDGPTTKVEMGPDGYPVLWMKSSRKQGDKNVVEIKPYRASYVRAALMIASTRQEAQHQCLLQCVRNGSARDATRQRTEAMMQPTLKLLEFASSSQRENQAILLRDLKLGINHIDREQLRRNSLLYPRYPTILRSLKATVEGAVPAKDAEAVDGPGSMTVYKIRCVALVELIDTEEDELELTEYVSVDGTTAKLYREEWVVHRPFRDFNTLHKHLKTQVSASETTASAGARLVGAATAAFSASNVNAASHRHRKCLIPSLGQAAKAGALGVTKKALQKRRAVLDDYLKHFLSPSHPLNQCYELMLFLGASQPLPSEARAGSGLVSGPDHLGRTDMFRTPLDDAMTVENEPASLEVSPSKSRMRTLRSESDSIPHFEPTNQQSIRGPPASMKSSVSAPQLDVEEDDSKAPRVREKAMLPPIKAKIDRVSLSKVRNAMFELIRSQFDFENASFFRNRLLSALKTMSFAVTSNTEFRNTLYDVHIKHLSADALAGWIDYGLSMLWPDGVFFESKPPTTPEESKEMSDKALEKLPLIFPDQVRAIIGQEITQDGLEMLHEMLQNRVVTKSLAYMLFDLLWAETFPELQDVLTGGEALENQ